ncbi:D-alanyl-D-alanine carboxypeptidase [Aerococcaceae bacterium DSM 111176]|nr:D-alanyl-D-alanine carboxypeptidase [Aerococcaceae bacterium DSM 111176]
MLKQHIIKKALISTAVFATLLSGSTPILAQELSKTPTLSSGSELLAPVPQFERPEDYPQELVDWYDQNMDTRSYVVIDAETNRVLAQRNGTTPYPIASMSKILAAYLIYEAIEAGDISMDTMITVPEEIETDITMNPNLSNVGLLAGEEYSVEDLLNGILIHSGNDATSVVMWELFGSEQDAVQAMNDQLIEWNITNAQMFTVSGAPNGELPESLWYPGSTADDQNYMSAADMALVGQHLVEDYPQVLDITSALTYVMAEGEAYETYLGNSNQLLPESESAYAREGVDGLKSGFTDGAGRTFITHSSNENGREVYAVVMGIFDEGTSSYWETEILLDGLLDYPDMYQNEALPTNLRELPEPEVEEEESTESGATENEATENLENERNNTLTNFMRDIFNVFN